MMVVALTAMAGFIRPGLHTIKKQQAMFCQHLARAEQWLAMSWSNCRGSLQPSSCIALPAASPATEPL
jgi:hypothetical protein